MITEERIAEALECFKKPGTDEQRRNAAADVFLKAVGDDIPDTFLQRLTVGEAGRLASLAEGNITRIILDAPNLDAFWIKIKDPSDDRASALEAHHMHTGLPLEMCDALYNQFHGISIEATKRQDMFYEKRIVEIQKKHEDEIAQMQELWQIERNMVLAWKKRVERLRRSLLRMAESPHYCDNCGANALGPEPHLDEDIPF